MKIIYIITILFISLELNSTMIKGTVSGVAQDYFILKYIIEKRIIEYKREQILNDTNKLIKEHNAKFEKKPAVIGNVNNDK